MEPSCPMAGNSIGPADQQSFPNKSSTSDFRGSDSSVAIIESTLFWKYWDSYRNIFLASTYAIDNNGRYDNIRPVIVSSSICKDLLMCVYVFKSSVISITINSWTAWNGYLQCSLSLDALWKRLRWNCFLYDCVHINICPHPTVFGRSQFYQLLFQKRSSFYERLVFNKTFSSSIKSIPAIAL